MHVSQHDPENSVNTTLGMSCLFLVIVLATLLVFGFAPVLVLTVGAIQFQDAVCDKNLVAWFWGLAAANFLLTGLGIHHQMTQHKENNNAHATMALPCFTGCVALFLFSWAITGTVWYCQSDVCDKELKTWSFWVLLYLWCFGPILACTFIVLACCVGSMALGMASASGMLDEQINTEAPKVTQPAIPLLRQGTTGKLIKVVSDRDLQYNALNRLRNQKMAIDVERVNLLGKPLEDMLSQMSIQSQHLERLQSKMAADEEQSHVLGGQLQDLHSSLRRQNDSVNNQSKLMQEQISAITQQQTRMLKQMRAQNAAQLFSVFSNKSWDRELKVETFAAWRSTVLVEHKHGSTKPIEAPSSLGPCAFPPRRKEKRPVSTTLGRDNNEDSDGSQEDSEHVDQTPPFLRNDPDGDHENDIEVEGLPLQHFFVHGHELSGSQQAELVSSPKDAHIEVVTWNVGSLSDDGHHLTDAAVHKDIMKIFDGVFEASKMDRPVDVLVVALQEVVPLSCANVVRQITGLSGRMAKRTGENWVDLLTEVLDSHPYTLAKYALYGEPVCMFGLLLCVFCRSDLVETHMHHFNQFELPVDCFHTGTKGIVACRFSLYDRSFCFINCHLQALTGKTEKDNIAALKDRLEQIDYAWTEIEFSISNKKYKPGAHRAVFLLGDTNMRLNLPKGFKARKEFGEHVRGEIAAGRYSQFHEYDQLAGVIHGSIKDSASRFSSSAHLSHELHHVMRHGVQYRSGAWQSEARLWQEPMEPNASIPFPPTFKLQVPGPGYSTKRAPAWTDRVLYRSRVARPLLYKSLRQQDLLTPSRNLADHDPVYARFEVACSQIDASKLARMINEQS